MIYSCCNSNRKAAVLGNPTLNGLDFLEVLDLEAPPLDLPRQQTLVLHCLKAAPALTPNNILITGGESITGITASWVATASTLPAALSAQAQTYFTSLPDKDNVIIVATSAAGDFSIYTLRLVNDASTASQDAFELSASLIGFDPQLTEVDFSFKIECGPEFDCQPASGNCAPNLPTPPPINYLAKDYGSFRTILLDRLNQLLPNWSATSEADFGIALAELVAYMGDRLSYFQDAVATEAYIETARRRVSLRRHALLVDYTVHDGCNARAWIQVSVSAPPGTPVPLDSLQTRFYTTAPNMPTSLVPGAGNEEAALMAGVEVFEPVSFNNGADAQLFSEHAQMNFYTWGNTDCCLTKGATEATLLGTFPNLQPGDVLVFQEVKGPQTSNTSDADIRHRCAVRLTQVLTKDSSNNPLIDPLFDINGSPITSATQTPQPITEIQWNADDALPFPICISSTFLDDNADQQTATNVSVVFGNIVLADHGLTLTNIDLGFVPEPSIYYPNAADRCTPTAATPVPPRYDPQLPDSPLTQAVPLPTGTPSASALTLLNPTSAIPAITLTSSLNSENETWLPQQNLLSSGASDTHFVVEVESDGTATLRFGDNTNGKTPASTTAFTATYRIGNGTAGNVGADSITNLAATDARITGCRNPLPASGGADPEATDQIRRRAPQAFLTQQRAITLPDYQAAAETNPLVSRAVASIRWTGSWNTVFIAAEPIGTDTFFPPAQQRSIRATVEARRLAGEDLELNGPQYISLQIALEVCVDPDYFMRDVQAALATALGSQCGGLFSAANFTFGQTIYLSPIYAAARAIPGVKAVTATTFQVQGVNDTTYLATGEIKLGPLQIARLENDPSFPSHGQLTFIMEGGK